MHPFVRPLAAAAALLVLPGTARAQPAPNLAALNASAAKKAEKRAVIEWGSPDAARKTCLAARPPERVFFEGDEVTRSRARDEFESTRVRTLKHLFVLKVPSRGFKLAEYRAKDGVLPLDLSQPLRALHGAISLSLENDGGLGFPLDEAAAKAVAEAHAAGTDTLEVSFELDPSLGAPCAGSLATDVYVVNATAAMLEFKDGLGKPLAKVEGPAIERHRDILGGLSGAPAVNVGLVSTTDKADVAEAGRRLLVTQPLLKACYEKEVAETNGLFGTMVFLLEVTAEGRIDKLVVTADDVLDEELRACAEDAIRKTSFLGLDGLPSKLQFPVEFKLVPKKK